MLQNCIRCINRDLVTRRVSVLDAQVVVVDIYVEIRQDQSVFNELPDDPGHLVAINIYNWIRYFNFAGHQTPPSSSRLR